MHNLRLRNFHSGVFAQEMKWAYVHAKTCAQILITTLFITATKWNLSTLPSAGEWISKFRCIHKMDYYSAPKRNKLVTHVTTGMNLKSVTTHERKQGQGTTDHTIPSICHFRTQSSGSQGWGGRERVLQRAQAGPAVRLLSLTQLYNCTHWSELFCLILNNLKFFQLQLT